MGKFTIKDPAAVSRGRKSGDARRAKARAAKGTPAPGEDQESTELRIQPVSQAGEKLILVNNETGEAITLEKNAAAVAGQKRKLPAADEFIQDAIQARKRLKEDVLDATLSKLDREALDLRANAKLFPELVNRDLELRQRPYSTKFGKAQASQATKANELQERARWFKDIEIAARAQSAAYEKAAQDAEAAAEHGSESTADATPQSGLEAWLGEDIPKHRQFSREEWRQRQNALLGHVHNIAENYRQELTLLSIWVNNALRVYERFHTIAATLLWHLSQKEMPSAIDLESWILSQATDSHRCMCELCDTRADKQEESELSDLEVLRREFAESNAAIEKARAALQEHPEWNEASVYQNNDPDASSGDATLDRDKEPEAADVMEIDANQAGPVDPNNDSVENLQRRIKKRFREKELEIERSQTKIMEELREKRSRIEWAIQERKVELAELKTTATCPDDIQACQYLVDEDERIQNADLDENEFVYVYTLAVNERSAWLEERQKKFDHLPAEEREVRTKLIKIRKSLRALEITLQSIEWKTLPEFQETFTSLPLSVKRESVMLKRLSKYSGFASAEEFDFCSTDAWATHPKDGPNDDDLADEAELEEFRKKLGERRMQKRRGRS